VVEPVIVCGRCHFCRKGEYSLCTNISFQYRQGQGSFAPYFVAEEDWVHPISKRISFEEGALIEPLSVALHAVNRASFQCNHTVAIFGGGAIGLMILLLIQLSGARKTFLVDIQEHRLQKAKEFGSSYVLNNSTEDVVKKILEKIPLGVDRAFEAVGLESTLIQSLEVLRKGGISILVGIFEKPEARIPPNLFIQKEIALFGSQGYCWDFQRAIKLVEKGSIKLKGIITHILPLSSLQEGFELMKDPKKKAIKVVIKVS
jgi:threonine dehydrogenase-like Zn-dependent dehydrogenase